MSVQLSIKVNNNKTNKNNIGIFLSMNVNSTDFITLSAEVNN